MSESKHPIFNDADLEASLRGLGVTELEQRLEFSPLLTGGVDTGTVGTDASVCCSCKLPPDFLEDGPTPASVPDPTPGDQFWGTGPTSGLSR